MLIRLLFTSIIFLGCALKQPTIEEHRIKIERLTKILLSLDSKVNSIEAYDLARSSIEYSQILAKEYKVISSPWIQNTLVNLGVKNRGLCHEWSEDLLAYLLKKNYFSFTFHTIGANIGLLTEHNALSVSMKGQGIKKSIILDAWRNSGDLYFKDIVEDKAYRWSERFLHKGLPSAL